MLFFLTGEIQTGKTKWLSGLVEELEAAGVGVAGVLAPGVWRARSDKEIAAREVEKAQAAAKAQVAAREAQTMARRTRTTQAARPAARSESECADASPGENARRHPDPAGEGRFEKLGIDNVLLPQHERIAFARRGDLAKEEGAHRPESQSAQAGLAWEIDDGAVTRVNAHFACLAEKDAGGTGAGAAGTGAGKSLLVVDELGELGRLELLRGEGLVEAMRLLEAGPSQRFPHALVVVRESLLEDAHAIFDGIWKDVAEIAPGDAARKAVIGLFNYQQKQKSRI